MQHPISPLPEPVPGSTEPAAAWRHHPRQERKHGGKNYFGESRRIGIQEMLAASPLFPLE